MARKSKLGIEISQYDNKNEYQRLYRSLTNKEYKRDKEKTREAAWKRCYGITRYDYNQMFEAQDGCCAICKTKKIGRGHTHFHVDHDHTSGVVRGLLCDKCNRGLGYFNDDWTVLERASEYLKKVPELYKDRKYG